ncbi:hypothetical protein [Actinomadura decatromicini]|uniref:Uncharacterized protein n=1 Tax=Actinomadura decatromicini TaxID=2604572 RepID=A0A5D3F7D6_9ACTN|nr:hypothetical protein [Actinomadura decatromicini]TYK43979.1 hypothetical protein FXF68_35230 [Actinomadura decatromicini]
MRRSTAGLVVGFAALLATCLVPASASAQQTTWTVTPGGTFTAEGSVRLNELDCYVRFSGDFLDSSGQGRIDKVTVHGCSSTNYLGYPTFRVPITMTATRYLSSIDTVAASLSPLVIDIDGRCPIRIGSPKDRVGKSEVLYRNQRVELWLSTGIGGGLDVWDPHNCYEPETVSINTGLAVTPAQTIRPAE